MDIHKRSLQIGLGVLLCALVFRLGGGITDKLAAFLSRPQVASTLLFLETGRVVRAVEPEQPTAPAEETVPETVLPTEPAAEPVVFTASDVGIKINNQSGKSVDLSALIQSPLTWNLKQDAPTVLIYHTHGTEAYTETSGYRTRDNNYNMISIGTAVEKRLTEAGISVIHDTVAHDAPSYDGSYAASRKSVQQYLAEYPTIKLVIDLHRDSMTDSAGKQLQTSVNGAAQMMFVIGTQADNWLENTALAAKLHALLERQCPGIMRSLCLRPQRFNQDLAPALLVEVGAAGNTRAQALNSAELLSDAIIELAQGTVYQP